MTDLTSRFEQSVEKVKTLKKKPDNNDLLKLYGLYKQAKFGNNTTEKPWAIQFEACAKWDAWTSCKGKSKDVAMSEYESFVKVLFLREKKLAN